MIADEYWIVRMVLRERVESDGSMEVVGESEDSEHLLALVEELNPDLVVLGEQLPGKTRGADLCRALLRTSSTTKLLVLGYKHEDELAFDFIVAGAMGYLTRDTESSEILSVATAVVRGEYRGPSWIIWRLTEHYQRNATREFNIELDLTSNQREVLSLFARGLTYGEIAEIRGNRPMTIRNTIYQIKSKLGIKSVQKLAIWAYKNGLTDCASDE